MLLFYALLAFLVYGKSSAVEKQLRKIFHDDNITEKWFEANLNPQSQANAQTSMSRKLPEDYKVSVMFEKGKTYRTPYFDSKYYGANIKIQFIHTQTKKLGGYFFVWARCAEPGLMDLIEQFYVSEAKRLQNIGQFNEKRHMLLNLIGQKQKAAEEKIRQSRKCIPEFYFDHAWLEPELRGRGLAQALIARLREIIKLMTKNKEASITVVANTVMRDGKQYRGASYWQKLGFKFMFPETAVSMRAEFIDFLEKKGCTVEEIAPYIPQISSWNDPMDFLNFEAKEGKCGGGKLGEEYLSSTPTLWVGVIFPNKH